MSRSSLGLVLKLFNNCYNFTLGNKEGVGAHSERVDTPGNLAAAIKRAEAANREGQAALLEVLTKVEKKIAQ